MTTYYDLILALIPVTLVGATIGLVLAGLTLSTAMPVAAAVSIIFIGHAMFVRAPVSNAIESETGIARTSAPGVNAD